MTDTSLDRFLDAFWDNKSVEYPANNEESDAAAVNENNGSYPDDEDCILNRPGKGGKLSGRTLASLLPTLIGVPVSIYVGVNYFGDRQYLMISLVVIVLSALPFFLHFEGRKPKARELVILSVLTAIAVISRAVFFMFPSFKCMAAVAIVTGISLGGESGFLVGALSMIVSNMLFGQGPWTPWQMLSMGLLGLIAGIVFNLGILKPKVPVMCVFGFLETVIIYGGIMNPASLIMESAAITPTSLLAYYLSGLPVDLVHGASTAFFLAFAGKPMLEKLGRIKKKYGLLTS